MTADSADTPTRRFPIWAGALAAFAAVGIGTLIVYPLEDVAPAVSLGIVYLPGVLLVSIFWGWRLGLLTTVASVAAFNWFHIPPLGRFAVAEDRDLVAIVVFGVVAFVASTLAEVARARTEEAERGRERADRALAELAELSRERDRMQAEAVEAEALRRSDELKTSLLRSVSHDLRTPLTSMIAAGAALGSPTLTAAERAELSEAVVERGQPPLAPGREPARRLQPRDRRGGAAPRAGRPWRGAGGGPRLGRRRSRGDPRHRRRRPADPEGRRDPARTGLCEPLRERGPPRRGPSRPGSLRGSSAPVSSSASSTRAPASPQSDRERIFEPFYRGDNGAKHSGSGLGLAIAKGFVEANGGEISVESLAGQGTTFVVSFPAAATEGAMTSAGAQDPRLRRRAADPPRPAGDPARRRL